MAWCVPCEQYFAPATLGTDKACSICGGEVQHRVRNSLIKPEDDGSGSNAGGRPGGPAIQADIISEKVPWHFWLLVAAATVYLGWRAVQGVGLLLRLLVP